MNIQSSIIFCDRCHPSLLVNNNGLQQSSSSSSAGMNGEYYFTKCGKIFCKSCITKRKDCSKCGQNCAHKPINENLNMEMALFFRDYSQLCKNLDSVYSFQMQRHRLNIQHLLKAISKLKKSIAQKTEIQLQIAEKEREIQQLLSEIDQWKRIDLHHQQQQEQTQNRHQQLNLNDSFINTFMQNVEQQNQQQININQNNLIFNRNELHFKTNINDFQNYSTRHHTTNHAQRPNDNSQIYQQTPSIRSRYSDKSSQIGLAYPIRRNDEDKFPATSQSIIQSYRTDQQLNSNLTSTRQTLQQSSQWSHRPSRFLFN